jgi:hypothetical protein
MNLEDQLSDITASLLQLEKNGVFLERLFSLDMGKWAEVTVLCRHLAEEEARLAELEESSGGTLRVTWLDYPNSAYGPGYAVIIFFLEELHWSNVALYNKQHFLEKLAHGADGT